MYAQREKIEGKSREPRLSLADIGESRLYVELSPASLLYEIPLNLPSSDVNTTILYDFSYKYYLLESIS